MIKQNSFALHHVNKESRAHVKKPTHVNKLRVQLSFLFLVFLSLSITRVGRKYLFLNLKSTLLLNDVLNIPVAYPVKSQSKEILK